jgi:hypothetical protein
MLIYPCLRCPRLHRLLSPARQLSVKRQEKNLFYSLNVAAEVAGVVVVAMDGQEVIGQVPWHWARASEGPALTCKHPWREGYVRCSRLYIRPDRYLMTKSYLRGSTAEADAFLYLIVATVGRQVFDSGSCRKAG